MTLDPRTRAMLDDFRREETPSAAQLEANFRAVEQRMHELAPTKVAIKTLSFPKLALLAGVAAVVGTVLWMRTPEPPPTRSLPPAAPTAPIEESFPVVAPLPAPAEPAPAVKAPPRRLKERRTRKVEAPSPAPEPQAAAPRGIDAEMRILNSAHQALKSGHPADALAALDAYQHEFPNGHLREAAAVTRIEALCQAGRANEGKSEGARFLAQHPGSPFAARINAACAK